MYYVIAAKCLCDCVLGRMSLGPWKFTETGGLARGLEVCLSMRFGVPLSLSVEVGRSLLRLFLPGQISSVHSAL